MARPLRIEYPGACYHITVRGNEQKEVFRSKADWEKFLSYLQSATERYGAIVHVYCLMTNHYHLLLETPLGNLSQIMRHINGAYTTYFNVKRKRAGHLFQGRYKAILIDADEYAKELSGYIHLNPVRAGITDRPEKYPWSSYPFYIGRKKKPEWLAVDFILSYFGKRASTAQKRYQEFVEGRIGQQYESPLKSTVASTILGGVDFVGKIREKYLKGKKVDRNVPALKELTQRPSIEEIDKRVREIFGENPKLSRKASLYLCHRYSGRKLREIGVYFGIGESAVSQTSGRLCLQLDKDGKLRKRIKQMENKLKL